MIYNLIIYNKPNINYLLPKINICSDFFCIKHIILNYDINLLKKDIFTEIILSDSDNDNDNEIINEYDFIEKT